MPDAKQLCACAIGVFLATAPSGGQDSGQPDEEATDVRIDPEAYRQIEVLMRAIETARENFVDEDKVTYERLVEGALKGLFSSLDSHSEYLTPRLLQEMRGEGKNPDSAAGITVEARRGGKSYIVSSVREGGPAARAGILAGDLLLAVGEATLGGMDIAAVRGALDGEPGTQLTVEVLTPGTAKPRTVGFRREQAARETVGDAQILPGEIAGDGPAIAYCRVRNFRESTPGELADALDGLSRQGMTALVLDLRANPGGLLDAAVALCSQFLPVNSLVAKAEGRPGTEHCESFHSSRPATFAEGLPLAVLVDDDSASSAEVVAGALQDHGRALIVGEKTYGKGSVQTVVQMGLDTGAAMRLTTARFVTPKGEAIDGAGIRPDIEVKGEQLPITTAARALRRELDSESR